MKKLIFLDIDGVLNNTTFQGEWNKAHWEQGTRAWLEAKFQSLFYYVSDNHFYNGYIVPENLENWNTLIDKTKADVVLSSDWRFVQDGLYNKIETNESIMKLFKFRGIKGTVVGATPYDKEHFRAREILRYFVFNGIYYPNVDTSDMKVLILDDIKDAGYFIPELKRMYKINCKFMHINNKHGLTKENVQEAIDWFNEVISVKGGI